MSLSYQQPTYQQPKALGKTEINVPAQKAVAATFFARRTDLEMLRALQEQRRQGLRLVHSD